MMRDQVKELSKTMLTLQVVDAGVFILRSFLSADDQIQCLDQCQRLYKNDEAMYKKHGSISNILRNIKGPHRGRYLLAFEPDKNSIASYYNDLAQSAFDYLQSQIMMHKQRDLILQTLPRPLPVSHSNQSINDENAEDEIAEMDESNDSEDMKQNESDSNAQSEPMEQHECQWISDRLNCVLYPLGSILGRHCDGMDGYVILFSLGCDATFYLQLLANERRKKGVVISMKSGDVIIFEGGDEQRVLHGVDGIVPNTAPAHFKGSLSNGRIGLQLRQYIGVETHKTK